MPFDASVVISFIHLAVVNDLMTMQMAMHIARVMSGQARWMHGHMREDKPASHGGITRVKESPPYVLEILCPL